MTVEETVDELRRYDLRVMQHRQGYRFSVDPLILCDFVRIDGVERVIDLGTGCGVIPLIISRRSEHACVTGVEFQEPLAELARRNVELNNLSGRVDILFTDILELRNRYPVSSFDLVLANPPYRRRGTGRVSPTSGRDRARHESTAGLADFLTVAKYLVKPAGKICFIYHPSRLAELCAVAATLKLSLARLRMVHGTIAAEARMLLVEFVKGRKGELKVLPPLVVFDDDGNYSGEMAALYREGR